MANKTTIGTPQDAAYIRSRQNLEQAGFNLESIEKILQNKSIAAILADFPQVANFLQKQFSRFNELVQPKYGFKAMYAEPPPLENFSAYFSPDRDTSRGTPLVDYIEGKYFANPELFVSAGLLSPQQVEYLRKMMAQGSLSDLDAMKGKTSAGKVEEEETAGGGGEGYGMKGYGGGGGGQGPQGPAGDSGYGFKGFGGGQPGTAPGYTGGGGDPYGSSGYGGGYGGGVPGGFASNYSQQERDYIMQNVGNTPVGGFFGVLMDREERARNIYAGIFDRMERRNRTRQDLMMEINNLDMTSPEGQRKFYMLQNEMQMITQSEKEDYDFIVRIQQAQNEFISLVKTIFDNFFKTQEKIIDRYR